MDRERRARTEEPSSQLPSGEIPERSKGADCKSAAVVLRRFESSSPHQTHGEDASKPSCEGVRSPVKTRAGVAQWLERQPSKLRVAGSNPVSRSNTPESRRRAYPAGRQCSPSGESGFAHVAQW